MLQKVNCTDLRGAIELGCKTMCSVFNSQDHNFPYFGAVAWPNAKLCGSQAHGECHVPGRHLNALLTAEHVLGLKIKDGLNTH